MIKPPELCLLQTLPEIVKVEPMIDGLLKSPSTGRGRFSPGLGEGGTA